MATTAAQVLASVQSLGYGTDTKAAQLAMLNQVQRRILNARRWTFALASESKVCTINQATVTFDTEVATTKRIDAVRLLGTAGVTDPLELEYVEPEVLRQYLHDNASTGTPRFWTRRGQSIELWPIPDAAYNLTVDTVTNATVLAEGSNVVVPDSHIDILVYGVIMQITFRERDWDGHNYARQLYAELFTEMLAQFGMQQRQQSTHIQSSGQWDMYDPEDTVPVVGWLN